MVRDLLRKHSIAKPDLLCATRGPGMIGSLSAGYNLAKGLAVAWDVPLVGVHHMLGHLLTPRFFQENAEIPKYPFVSLLVSGGHTMLVLSQSTTQHKVLANTMDIAIGDMLDKCARELGITGSMLAKEMEAFISSQPINKPAVDIALQFPNPLQNKQGRTNILAYSFAGFITSLRTNLEKYFPGVARASDLGVEQRRELARRMQHAIFNHVVTKSRKALQHAVEDGLLAAPTTQVPLDFVCAGGVASNMTLRQMLDDKLLKPGFPSDSIKFHFPPPKWCTDNALMIGWAGIELWESAGLYTDLSALPTARWPIEELLDMDGWLKRE